MPRPDPFGARASLGAGLPDYWRLAALADLIDLDRAPVTLKILLENALRNAGGGLITRGDVETLASWRPGSTTEAEVPFMPSRVLLQDFTGVPAIVDLAAMRDAMAELGGDPARVNPLVPADLVIDHSVQVDQFGTPGAFAFNVAREYERNGERYQLLRWAQTAFRDLRVVPPGTGIVHQVNLEYLATVVADRTEDGADAGSRIAFPDTVVGTDSHTTMINGLGVLAWGVGGIEAEAALLGQPIYMPMPRVVGVRLSGELPRGSTATDLVLVVTQMLRGLRRRRGVRRVHRRRAGQPGARRPRDDRQHEPGVRGDLDALPDRRRDPRLPAPDRPHRRARRARRGVRPRAGPVAAARRRPRVRRPADARSRQRRAVRRRAAPPAGSRAAHRPARELPVDLPRRPAQRRRRRRHGVPARVDRSARRARLDRHGLRRDRGHHLVHEHLEPDGHGRRRAPRPERRAARACACRRR